MNEERRAEESELISLVFENDVFFISGTDIRVNASRFVYQVDVHNYSDLEDVASRVESKPNAYFTTEREEQGRVYILCNIPEEEYANGRRIQVMRKQEKLIGN